MTPVNMAKHRNNPNMPFWRMIKEGNDHFEVTKQEPKVTFCEKKYVFDAVKPPNATRDPVFDASAKCPAYVIPDEIADAVRQKQEQDDAEMARLVAKGTPVARMNTGIDGGMNKVFAAAVPDGNTGLSEGGEAQGLSFTHARLPGTIPFDHVNPPHAPSDDLLAGAPEQPKIAAAPATAAAAPATRVASATPNEPSSGGFFSNLARKVGFGSAAATDTTATASPPPQPSAAPAKPKIADAKHAETAKSAKPDTSKQAATKPALKPSVTDTPSAAPAAPAVQSSMVGGAQPIVSSNSFDNRFSAVK
jgi:hypothetical protein